jgi:adenosylcobinamide-phosphate guanylyltransferase
MDLVDALVTAGGKGTRMRDVDGEKPLLPLLGRPMIEWVLDALRSSEGIGRTCVSVSDNAPRTRRYLERLDVEVVETSGSDYVADLNQAMGHCRTGEVLVCPADMPLLTSQGIDAVLSSFRGGAVDSLSVAVPLTVVRSVGAAPSFCLEVDGREVVLCGVSVVDREQMLAGGMLSQGYMVTEEEQFALNVNTVEELRSAERLLRQRTKQ